MHIRTKRKDSEFKDDLHHFTNKWQEVDIGKVRGDYLTDPNLEVREDKAKETAVEEPKENT